MSTKRPGRSSSRRSRWTLVAALAAVAAAHFALARSAAVPQIHSGGDNAAYVSLAHSLAQDGSYRELWHPDAPPHTKYPPLYPAFLSVFILSGAKTWGAFKASSLALTTLSVALCFLWARRLAGLWVGLAVALLFGVSYPLLFAAQWILSDPLFLVATMGSLYCLAPRAPPDRAADSSAWELWAGLALAAAAYFTRTAGAPLVLAAAAVLGWQRRWKALGIFAAAFALPAALWHFRGGEYATEFWLVNPYIPDLGRAGFGDIVVRAAANFWQYATEYVPSGLFGLPSGSAQVALGCAVTLAVVVGWLHRLRPRPGAAEFFALLYGGLILAWPEQWSSDRFVLPLFPLALLYAGESIMRAAAQVRTRWQDSQARPPLSGWLRRRLPGWLPGLSPESSRRAVAVLALLALASVPAGLSRSKLSQLSTGCAERVAVEGPFGCYPENIRAFGAVALWAGQTLPEGSSVLSRKPRLFYAFSGLPSVTYPFTRDGSRLLQVADSLGIGYVLRSNWDGSEAAYVDPAVIAHSGRFCLVTGFRFSSGATVSLIAITATQSEDDSGRSEADYLILPVCSPEADLNPPSRAATASMTIPILDQRSEPGLRP